MLSKMKARLLSTPRRRQAAVSAGIISAALLTSASIFATGPTASPATHVEKAWPVSVMEAQPRRLQPTFSAFGRLESNRVARLRSDLVARIESVNVREGDWVEAGTLLVQLDNREASLHVLEREAELKQHEANLAAMRIQLQLEQESASHFESKYRVAQDKLERHTDLLSKRLIAKSLYDEVQAQADQASIDFRNHMQVLSNLPNQIAAHEAGVARAEALLAQAQLDLDKAAIRAPFSGPVLAVQAAPGDHSNLSAPLIEMADADGFEVRVQVPDDYAAQFESLEQGAVTAFAENGAELTMTRLASHVRTGQTGMDAFFEFDDGAVAAPALGRVFNLRISLPPQPQLIAVPVQSIYDNNRVYAVRENRLVGFDVERVGEYETTAEGYRILIRTDALAKGDQVITTQLPRAITGLLVDVANGDS